MSYNETIIENFQNEKLRIIALGRSKTQMEAMLLKKIPDHIQWEGYLGDFSELSNLKDLMQKWNENPFKVDLIFHSIGIIFPKKKKTKEDIEINFATSVLSRFYPTKLLHQKNFVNEHCSFFGKSV
ncbi:hypothetical protein AB3N58_14460 [Leptospira sp. WS60.C2]